MEKKNKKKDTTKNKARGSGFERELAKLLSIWVYGKESVIRRHPTSGAEKGYGDGADLAVFQPGYEEFNYFVEAKRGYKDDLLNARKQILEWYGIAQTKNKKNNPIWIIWKILNRGIILATNKKLNVVEELFIIGELFVYDFKELIKHDFKEITAKEKGKKK